MKPKLKTPFFANSALYYYRDNINYIYFSPIFKVYMTCHGEDEESYVTHSTEEEIKIFKKYKKLLNL